MIFQKKPKIKSLSPGLSLGRFVQIVFRIKIGNVDFAEILRRRVDFGLHLVRIGRVIVQFFDANELPRLIYPRVIELVTIFPAFGASTIMFDAESVASRYDAVKGIAENASALRTHDYSLVALRQSQLAVGAAQENQQRALIGGEVIFVLRRIIFFQH